MKAVSEPRLAKIAESKQMKWVWLMAILCAPVCQSLLFWGLWSLGVNIADDMGHEQRRDLSFGIGIHYGTWLILWIFLVGSLVGGFCRNSVIRWGAISVPLVAWVWLLSGALGSYPIRMAVFLGLGIAISVVGSGLIVPFIANRRAIGP